MKTALIRTTIACLWLGAWACAQAHDTWFERRDEVASSPELALGTGNRYPRQESGVGTEYLARQGCRSAASEQVRPLKAMGQEAAALLLHAPAGASSCWAQLTPFEVTLAPDKIAVYLQEIQAGPEVRQVWAAMAARGLPWRERYVKNARIELGAVPDPRPTPLGLDLHLETGASGPRVGQLLSAQALRDGQPLPGLALAWRSADSPLALWRRTDAQGRVSFTPPLPGRWLLHGVDLRQDPQDPQRWDSRFTSLAFDVAAAATTP